MESFSVPTEAATRMIDITAQVSDIIRNTGVSSGICTICVPHTTCGITINENADPSVQKDVLKELNTIVPFSDGYLHAEGNSAAHIKTIMTGTSVNVPIEDGRPVLGTWQGIYLCEFDGPRTRKVLVQMVSC